MRNMEIERDFKFVEKAGQKMYFDEKIAKKMIGREENIEHFLTSKVVEAILVAEFGERENLKIAELGAGAHPRRYENFLRVLKEKEGKIYWVDQSPIMLSFAKKKIPEEFKEIFKYVEQEMTLYLKRREGEFDGLIFKYSFNYIVPCSFEEWMEILYKALKENGKVVATLNLYEEGMKERSYNAIYTIKGKRIKTGYFPKDGEIIEIHFLETPGDQSSNPKTFATTKILYQSPISIKRAVKGAGFLKTKIFKNWTENSKWRECYERLNPGLESKGMPILFLEK